MADIYNFKALPEKNLTHHLMLDEFRSVDCQSPFSSNLKSRSSPSIVEEKAFNFT